MVEHNGDEASQQRVRRCLLSILYNEIGYPRNSPSLKRRVRVAPVEQVRDPTRKGKIHKTPTKLRQKLSPMWSRAKTLKQGRQEDGKFKEQRISTLID